MFLARFIQEKIIIKINQEFINHKIYLNKIKLLKMIL